MESGITSVIHVRALQKPGFLVALSQEKAKKRWKFLSPALQLPQASPHKALQETGESLPRI